VALKYSEVGESEVIEASISCDNSEISIFTHAIRSMLRQTVPAPHQRMLTVMPWGKKFLFFQ
jgi:hypothetical protein